MKARRRSATKSRASTRRWHIPPPLIHGSETLEGGAILQEWGNELGVVLWQASRDVLLWATTEPHLRAQTFSSQSIHPSLAGQIDDSRADPRLRTAFALFDQIVQNPEAVREEQVARACRLISEWADEEGRLETALSFAQNAALASHGDAAAAFWVGTVAVRLNDHARAEVWFRRAIGLARRARDWRMYSRAFGGLGNLYMRRGNLPAARRLHTRALRGARRGGMRREQAAALHDLFGVAVETGQTTEAERFARHALEAYGTRNTRLNVLAHDVAYFWMENGHFERALAVFTAVLPLIDVPFERMFVLADIARAAAGVGKVSLAEEAAEEVWKLAAEAELEHGAARTLLDLARGYVMLGDADKAEAAARKAIEFAGTFREGKVQFAAEALLDSLAAGTPAEEVLSPVRSAEPAPGDTLAAEFVRTLETIAGAA